jgi:RNA recognition motif-containing protein
MDIHVTNLHLNLVESDLRRIFSPYGEVHTVNIVRDKLNHRSSGRAFIDMPVDRQGKNAILSLNGVKLNGKSIIVSELKYDPNLNTNSFRREA